MAVSIGRPIDTTDPDVVAFLQGVQGNIIQPHSRGRALHLFFSFGSPSIDSRRGARNWIGSLRSSGRITTAHDVWRDEQSDTYTGTFTSLALSSDGYEFLGRSRPSSGAFREGMRERGERLADPPMSSWQVEYQFAPGALHGLLIIANNVDAELRAVEALVSTELGQFGGSILHSELGVQLYRDSGPPANKRYPIEHFGYADGISQPSFFLRPEPPSSVRFDHRTPLRRVLTVDPQSNVPWGSYLVYRKLEQNVRGFRAGLEAVAAKLGLGVELAGAMAIGRFENGTPLASSAMPIGGFHPKYSPENDFNYGDDPNGDKVPLHSHIRKVNPRDELGFLVDVFAQEERRRIARRGITYGERPDLGPAGGQAPTGGVGLLFICYQADIADQFEFIQRKWANSPNFKRGGAGLDPVIGRLAGDNTEGQNWPDSYGATTRTRFDMGRYVTLRGGEYFFVPSMDGLQELARHI